MSNESERSPNRPSDSIPEDMNRGTADIAQVRETLDLTRSELRRTRAELAQNRVDHDSHVRRTKALWAIAGLLIVGIAALVWWGYPLLDSQKQLSANVPALHTAIEGLKDRARMAEENVTSWANDRFDVANRFDKLEKSLASNLAGVQSEVRTLVSRSKQELTQGLRAIENRVSGVESVQRESHDEVARLEDELGRLRREMASMKEENQRQLMEAQEVREVTRSNITAIDRRLNTHQSAVGALTHQVDRQRVDFELPVGRTQEVVKGIFVTVKETNVARKQVDGWLQIAQDGRIVWLRSEIAQKPIEFSSRSDARPYQLVFTGIEKSKTSGYLLVPRPVSEPVSGN